MKINLTSFTAIVTAVLLYALVNVLNFIVYFNDRDSAIKNSLASVKSDYDAILNVYERNSRFVFTEVVSRDEVMSLFSSASKTKDPVSQAVYRNQLHDLLLPSYRNMSINFVRQLHFHFRDSTSFLRMHRPERFGDSVRGVRKTVDDANETGKATRGFEEGRILNGYRFVYPARYRGEQIGTVEVSVSLAAIGITLQTLFNYQFQFILKKDVVEGKVFADELANYAPWPCNPNYLVDIEVSRACIASNDPVDEKSKICRQINRKIVKAENFAVIQDDSEPTAYHFVQVYSYHGKPVGYMVIKKAEPILGSIRARFLGIFSAIQVIFFLLMAGIFYLRRSERRIDEYRKFLPICSHCKKVRPVDSDPEDPSSWISIEQYFDRRTKTNLSHGICPDCFKKHYPEYHRHD